VQKVQPQVKQPESRTNTNPKASKKGGWGAGAKSPRGSVVAKAIACRVKGERSEKKRQDVQKVEKRKNHKQGVIMGTGVVWPQKKHGERREGPNENRG